MLPFVELILLLGNFIFIPKVFGLDAVHLRIHPDHFDGISLYHHGYRKQNDFCDQGKHNNGPPEIPGKAIAPIQNYAEKSA